SSSTGSCILPGTGVLPTFIDGPIARAITRFVPEPVIMNPPMPTLAPPWTYTRPEMFSNCTFTGVAVGAAVGVGVAVSVGVAVAVAVAVGVAVGEAVAVAVAVGEAVAVAVGVAVAVAVGVGDALPCTTVMVCWAVF